VSGEGRPEEERVSWHDGASSDAILAPPVWSAGERGARDRFAYGALIAFLGIFLLAPQNLWPALGGLRIALVAGVLAGGAYLITRLSEGRPLTLSAPEIRLSAALFLWAAVTIPFAYWPGGAWSVLFGLLLRTLILFWLMANLVSTVTRLRQITLVLSLASIPLAATAVLHTLRGEGGAARIEGYDAPLTGNPNDLALMLNVIIPLTIALAMLPRPPLSRAVLGGIASLGAVGVIMTFSRAGFLTLATTAALWCRRLAKSRALEAGLIVVVIVLLAIPFLPAGWLGQMGTIANIEADRTGSAQERWQDIRAAVGYIAAHPIVGAGIGMNPLALNEVRGTTWRVVHNVYLQVGVELGVLGIVLFVLLLRGALRSARSARDTALAAGERDVAELAGGVHIALVGFLVASMFHPVAYHAYVFILGALAIAAKALAAEAAS
jgi:hypothetical protein